MVGFIFSYYANGRADRNSKQLINTFVSSQDRAVQGCLIHNDFIRHSSFLKNVQIRSSVKEG